MSATTREPLKDFMATRLSDLSLYLSTEENQPPLSIETLLDAFIAIYADVKSLSGRNEQITGFISKCSLLSHR